MVSTFFFILNTDYGMLESWKCKKVFKLDQNNPDDVHYLHTNGMLYMVDQEPYSQETYCMENALTPNGSTIVRNIHKSHFYSYDD